MNRTSLGIAAVQNMIAFVEILTSNIDVYINIKSVRNPKILKPIFHQAFVGRVGSANAIDFKHFK